jgi:hypothetical protein
VADHGERGLVRVSYEPPLESCKILCLFEMCALWACSPPDARPLAPLHDRQPTPCTPRWTISRGWLCLPARMPLPSVPSRTDL